MTPEQVIFLIQALVFIAVLAVGSIVIILVYLGDYGRALLWASMPGGGTKALIQVKSPTGRHSLHRVKPRGQTLYKTHKKIWFLPRLLKIEQNDKDSRDKINYNEILKSKDSLNGKPLFLASEASSLTFSPELIQAIEEAKQGKDLSTTYPKAIESILVDLKQNTKYDKDIELSFMTPLNIDTIEEYVNMSYTSDELDETYRRGYLKGIGDKMALQSKVQEYFPYLLVILGVVLLLIYAWDTGILGAFTPA